VKVPVSLAREIVEILKRALRAHPGAPPMTKPGEATQGEMRHKQAGLVGREIKRRLLVKDEKRRERLRKILELLKRRGITSRRDLTVKERQARLMWERRLKKLLEGDPLSPDAAQKKAAKIVARLLRYYYAEYQLSAKTISDDMDRPGSIGPGRFVSERILAQLTFSQLIVLHLWRFFWPKPSGTN
jgi:hypothetical protein